MGAAAGAAAAGPASWRKPGRAQKGASRADVEPGHPDRLEEHIVRRDILFLLKIRGKRGLDELVLRGLAPALHAPRNEAVRIERAADRTAVREANGRIHAQAIALHLRDHCCYPRCAKLGIVVLHFV